MPFVRQRLTVHGLTRSMQATSASVKNSFAIGGFCCIPYVECHKIVLLYRMKSVEQQKQLTEAAPLVYWADRIAAEDVEGVLNLSGIKGIPPSMKERGLMDEYFDALANANSKVGNDNTSPHIIFANCMSETLNDCESAVCIADEARQSTEERARAQKVRDTLLGEWQSALRKYVLTFGPVLAEPASVQVRQIAGDLRTNSRWVEVRAQQRWDVLKREQRTLSAVMRVFEQTRSKTPSHNELFRAARAVVSGTSHWVDACQQESAALRPGRERPSWTWAGNDQFRAQALAASMGPVDLRVRFTCPACGEVHQIQTAPESVSQVLTCKCGRQSDLLVAITEGNLGENACPDWAIAKGRVLLCHILNAFPAKLTDYNGIPFEMPSEDVSAGILPVLYQLLRSDYLRDARIARCAWKDCTKWFRVGGHESPCCSPEHSLKYRQSKYYRVKGKAARELRKKEKEKKARDGERPRQREKRRW
jgi:hypothetical protein